MEMKNLFFSLVFIFANCSSQNSSTISSDSVEPRVEYKVEKSWSVSEINFQEICGHLGEVNEANKYSMLIKLLKSNDIPFGQNKGSFVADGFIIKINHSPFYIGKIDKLLNGY